MHGHSDATASRRPFCLIHAERYAFREAALRGETYLKTAKGRCVLKLMLIES